MLERSRFLFIAVFIFVITLLFSSALLAKSIF